MQQLQSVQLALASEPVKFTGNDSASVSYSNSSNSPSFAEMVRAETEKYSGNKEDVAEDTSLPKSEKSEKSENVSEKKAGIADDKKIAVHENVSDENIEQSDEIAFAQTEISSIIALAEENQKNLVQDKTENIGEEIDQSAMVALMSGQTASQVKNAANDNIITEEKIDSVAEVKAQTKTAKSDAVLDSIVATDVLAAGEKIAFVNSEDLASHKKTEAQATDFLSSAAGGGAEKNIDMQSAALEFAGDFAGANTENGEEKPRSFVLDKDGKITVSDFRTKVEAAVENIATNQVAQAGEPNTSVKISEVSTKNIADQNVSAVQMNMNLMQVAEQNILSTNNQTASAQGSNFQAMLANQIQQNAGEFVKAGSIVLRDGNVGEINLTLNPEKLGNVKISLQLTDKLIAGQIVVDSREAYNAFKSSSDSLKQAFVQSGFEMEGFELSWSGQDAQQNFADKRNDEGKHFVASRIYGDYASAESSEGLDEYASYSDYKVDMTA